MKGEKLRIRLMLRDGNKCWYCGKEMTLASSTVEHLIPVSQGGPTSEANCVLTHDDCNREVGDLPLGIKIEWRSTLRLPTDSRFLNKLEITEEFKYSQVHLRDAFIAGMVAGRRSPKSKWASCQRGGDSYIIFIQSKEKGPTAPHLEELPARQ